MHQPCLILVLAASCMLVACGCGGSKLSVSDPRDEIMYMLVTDRFDDGDSTNNSANGPFQPESPRGIHGGDLKGIQRRLPYLRNLGITSIWLTPVAMNTPDSYHGYWIQDMTRVDPRLGSMEELRQLITSAHVLGMRVYLDIVCNHFGPLSQPVGGAWRWNPSGYTLEWKDPQLRPLPVFFQNLNLFHNFGEVETWKDPEQILGELPGGLDDLKTELPEVRAELLRIMLWWMEVTGCDGFRVDTVKHVEMDFWSEFLESLKTGAEARGRKDFFVFGEVFDFSDDKCAPYTQSDALGRRRFDAVLNFSLSGSIRAVFGSDDSLGLLVRSIRNLHQYAGTSDNRNPIFIDNHDLERFLHLAGGDRERLVRALVFLFGSPGLPVIYYGTEQGLLGGASHEENREDLFNGKWKGKNAEGDGFVNESRLHDLIRSLSELRGTHPVLRRGSAKVTHVDEVARVLVMRREWNDQSAFVTVNLSPRAQVVSVQTKNVLHSWAGSERLPFIDGKVELALPPSSVDI